MTKYRRIEDGLDHRLMRESRLEIIEQSGRALKARWNVWEGALNSIGTCQGMIPFGMADIIAAILCDREGIIVTTSGSCFYHEPLYEGEVEARAFFQKSGKVNSTVDVQFYQKGVLCFQSTFIMHATRKTYDSDENGR